MTMNLPNQPGATNADVSLAARRREVENALLTQALCGRRPSAATLAQLRRYETGELSREVAFASLYRG
ncbi:MAG: antitoxin VbhA family protein [Janthinobacterium lividum]